MRKFLFPATIVYRVGKFNNIFGTVFMEHPVGVL